MLKRKITLAALAFSLLIGTGYAANTVTMITPDKLIWQPVKDMPAGVQSAALYGDPSKHEFFIAYVKLPADYQVPVHKHPIVENDTVISGTYYLGIGTNNDRQSAVALTPGSFVSIPVGTYHYGYTKDEVILEISGIGPWGMIYKK